MAAPWKRRSKTSVPISAGLRASLAIWPMRIGYAHGKGVVHRDVKPGNIMIDRRGDALLTDFGLAHLESSQEKLTHDGSIMGTPAYMAPEQADSSFGDVGPASDQYSLGVVLYEMLCGQTPFSGPPAVQLFNVVHRSPPRPRSQNRAIPKDLEIICLKAMAQRPQDRYAEAAALAEDLRRWLNDEPIEARRMGTPERAARWARRNPIVALLVAAVVIVTFVGLTAVIWQWGRAELHRFRAERALIESKRQEEAARLQETQCAEERRTGSPAGKARSGGQARDEGRPRSSPTL